MAKRELILTTPHPGQKKVINCEARFRVVACGRRWGKTTLGIRSILIRAAERHQACWWLAPTYGMASQVWRDLKYACRDVPNLAISETEQRLDFPGGGWLAIHSAHLPDNLRGAGLDFVVLDEAAFMEPTVWPEVVRPMLLERKGRALFLSSPKSRNWFWEIYQMGQNKKRSWVSFHFPSSANPLIDPAELESIRLQTAERIYREEYLAEFIEDSGQVFRGIYEAATAPRDAVPTPDGIYVAGLDWGREGDYTAIVVIDANARQVVALDRFNQVSWALQRGRLKAIHDHWRLRYIWAEANSIGSPNIEALQAEGLPIRPFITTAATKPPLIESLALAIERRELALLPDENLLAELAVYTQERLPAGGFRYTAPSGLHDDLVIALALAHHGVHFTAFPISFA